MDQFGFLTTHQQRVRRIGYLKEGLDHLRELNEETYEAIGEIQDELERLALISSPSQ